ncbi:MAG: OmpH family outer membrane protein [Bacteroidales bacterium]|nr:OmpH family outer membrane protein [Candidatus Cacconaster merdequi]
MKKALLLVICVTALCTFSSAQEKFGHINSQELISLMSERDSAFVKLQAYNADLVETMQGMEEEYNTKYAEYNRKQAEWSAVVRENKERDIQELVQRIQQFQQSAQQDMAQMQQELMAPVFQKAQDALTKIAKDNSLLYVFDLSAGSLLYFDEAKSVDLLPLAKKALGIPAEKVAPTQFNTDQPQQ